MDHRARVLILSQHLPSPEKPFRASFVLDQAEALNEVCEVIIVDIQGSPHGFSIAQPPPDVLNRHLPTLRVCHHASRQAFDFVSSSVAMLRVITSMVRDGRRPSVVHAHWWAAAIPAVLACKALKIPLVITEHGSRWSTYRLHGKSLLLGRAILRSAAMVLPVSGWLESVLEDQGVKARMHVIPNIVDVDTFRPPSDFARDVGRIPVLALVGRLADEKGIDDAIRAVSILRARGLDCRLEVIGGGDRLRSLTEIADSEGVADLVTFHGAICRQEIARLFRSADILVSATKTSETFGVAVAEGLAAGLPAVCTAVGAIPELVSENTGVLVEPNSPASLAQGIELALSRTWDRAIISGSVERFRRDRVVENILDVYREVGLDVGSDSPRAKEA